MKGQKRYQFIHKHRNAGAEDQSIADQLGISKEVMHTWLSRNKNKYEIEKNDTPSKVTRKPRVITLTRLIDLAERELIGDPRNKKWSTFIERAEGRDQYLIRYTIELCNKL